MTFAELGKSYIQKARIRLEAVKVLFDKQDYSDVIREMQEIVELALKAMLRKVGIEPPHIHELVLYFWNIERNLKVFHTKI